jgi:hypothetical protein
MFLRTFGRGRPPTLGLAGYYRRSIEGFSKLVKPLTSLLEKGKEFEWDEAY